MKTSVRSRRDEKASSPTVLEVAKVAGVSVSTVSRILNGTARVSEAKRQAVEDAIAALDFEPNALAQSLKRGRSMTVGVLTQDVSSSYFTETLKGVEHALTDTGYAPLIASGHWNAEEEAHRVRLLIARRVDGIIILSGNLTSAQITQYSGQVPVVATGHRIEAPKAWAIELDNERGGVMATRHLLDLGHRRIAHIRGPEEHADAEQRFAGYRRALEEAGVQYDERLVVPGDFYETSGVLGVAELLARGAPFTAIFAANDQMAYGVRLALSRQGIRVPDDISLIGFDDLPGSLYTTPPLTTVRQPLFDMGRIAAGNLLRIIDGDPPEPFAPEVELVVRETTRRLR
ncbi:LacI family DNA-binding transcriptional regulator [Aquisalimonas asiatica]|uniref:Transcriptional regulator, LacI family n=1 Tax=Aquisalimonas asiatica TaxID=406100 RepID=A0A1H8RJZ4_9GAMM|nr:substrate-binding domain-containing protein [Aquisalimonas asiatica]SEO66676.1 transcriptional regulator, LacI family [Aquisalimonas asiatica]